MEEVSGNIQTDAEGNNAGLAWGQRKRIVFGLLYLLVGIYWMGDGLILFSNEPRLFFGDFFYYGLALLTVAGLLVVGGERLLTLCGEYRSDVQFALFFVAVILTFRTFVYEPFKIPSGSMIPSLLVGDYLFVSKFSYGVHIPFTRQRLGEGEGPQRGDVAVFRYPMDPNKAYIKRVVGLPGDRVEYRDKLLFINGQPTRYTPQGEYTYRNEQGFEVQAQKFMERLGERDHEILNQPFSYSAFAMSQVVPQGHYFVMGDNRDNSNDSRAWGFVPAYQLVGRAVVLFWSWGREGPPRWERIGRKVL